MNSTFARRASGWLLLFALVAPVAPRVLLAQQAPQQLTASTPLPVDPQVRIGTLPNGLKYYVRANSRPEKRAELRLVVNAGSNLEENDQRGLAHFIEHMAFNGTKNFQKNQIVQYLEGIGMRFGADLNAYTSFDETVYMLTLPTDRADALSTGMQILEDWAGGITFDAAELDRERGVVMEEWRGRLGAGSRLQDAQMPVMLKGSRYAERIPIGLPEILQNAPRERLVSFYQKWYRPDNMAVVAVGDFDPAAVEALLKEHMGRVPAGPAGFTRPVSDVPSHAETYFLITADPELTSTSVDLLHKLPVRVSTTVGDYRQTLVEQLFDAMLNDRLDEIRQKPDAPFLGAYSSKGGFVRTTDVYAVGATVADGGVEKGLEAVLIEAERVARFGFTPGELERSKLNMIRGYERAYAERDRSNSAGYADEYIRNFLQKESIPGIAFEYQIAQAVVPGITLDEVNRLAREWLTDKNRVVLVSGPKKEGLALPTEAQLRPVLERAARAEITAYVDRAVGQSLLTKEPTPGRVVEEARIAPIDATEWKLSNGVRVILKATDFREDEVVMNAFAAGGQSLASDADNVNAIFAADIAQTGGLGELSAVDLQRALAGKAASVNPFIDELEQGFQGSASPKDLETMLQMIYLTFTSPRFDPQASSALVERIRAALANRSADPEAAYSDTVQVTLSQNHPRYAPLSTAMLAQLDQRRAFDFFKDRFADANGFTFVFVGNIDPAAMKPLVEKYLGGLPTTGRRETYRDTGVRPPRGVVTKTVRQGLEPRAQTEIVFSGTMPYTRENRYAIRSLSDVLEIRLQEVLREDMGGTYGVQTVGNAMNRPEQRYQFIIAFGAAPAQLETLVTALFKELERIKTEGPSAEDIQKVREIQRRERETSIRQNGYWLGQISGYAREGLNFADIPRYEELVEGLNADIVKNAAKQLLDAQNYVRVTLLPAGSERR